MSKVIWNDEQQLAINEQNKSILVSAAAGSGKTAVLVERVIQLLTDKNTGVMADELLIVTFTNLAADEMKNRINKRITQLLDESSDNPRIDETHLRNQQLLIDKAHISTIDSFCRDVVKMSYTRFDISPDYRIADSSELKALKYKAAEEIAEKYYPREDFKNLASLLTTADSDTGLKDTVIRFHEFLSALPFPKKWLENMLATLHNAQQDIRHCIWIEDIVSKARKDIIYISGLMEDSCQIFDELEHTDILSETKRYDERLAMHLADKNFITRLSRCQTFDDIQQCLYHDTFSEKLLQLRGLSDEGKLIYENYKNNRKTIQKIVTEMKNRFFVTDDELREQLRKATADITLLTEFITDFDELYTQRKREKNVMDFPDIERYTLLTLAQETENGEYTTDGIRYTVTDEGKILSQSFKQVIVDEYQDVNQLQDVIFKIISQNDKNLFVVGDVKQSIYGFRQAMPDIFIGRRNIYDTLPDSQAKNIILKRNYRSRYGVTDYVNFVFSQLMQKDLGNLEYLPEDYLVCGADYQGNNPYDVYFHINNLTYKNKKITNLYEAKKIAEIIQNTVGKYDVKDGDTTRKAQYRDVAILMRTVKDTTTLTDYLRSQEIPVVTETTTSLLDCKEVQMVVDLLRVIDNPLQDIPLYSTLVSPIYGFTPQEVAQIRCNTDRTALLYRNIITESEHNEKVRQFVADIEYYRELSANNPADVLINLIYRKTAITEFAVAQVNGEIILNNLRLLYECAKNFENDQNRGITGFIRYIDHAVETGAEPEAQTGSSTDGNCVKIMTIHHSKGLEFPICIIANTGRQPKNYTDKVYFSRSYGVGLQIKDAVTSVTQRTFLYDALVNKLKSDEVAEELRVLYVALTRAKEQLHIVGSLKGIEKIVNKISLEIAVYHGINSEVLLKNNYMLHWLIAVLLMMKPQDNQNNPLWKYANASFLRNIAHNPDYPFREYHRIFTEIDSIEDTPQPSETTEQTSSESENLAESTINISALNKRFQEVYPYQNSVNVPSVVTPSSMATHYFSSLNRFAFEDKGSRIATERGKAMHRFMECADIEKATVNPQEELERLVEYEYLSEEQAKLITINYITRCLQTPIMQRYIHAPKKYRETQFEVMVSARLTGYPDCEEEHLLRGAVDCAFEENGELIIIDYKTDYVKDMYELKEKYALQLELYKTGLSATLKKKVRSCYIYSFYLNSFIEI